MEGESDEFLFELADFVPEPLPEPRKWGLGAWMRRAPESRWGAQLLRIASDIVVVCDEGLTILHHNRAFLKAVGYQEGSFCGRNLVEFFGFGERADVVEVFEDWRRGHAAGMRFQANLSSKRGARPYEFRAVRSRRKGVYSYYLIGRDGQKRRPRESAEDEQESIFRGLPVAAWRTDGDLRITRVFGSLWPELGAATEDLVGEVFGRRHDSLLPSFLHDVECSDTLVGMSLQTEVVQGWDRFSVTVEPFLDADGKVVGTVGMLRRAGAVASGEGGEDRVRSVGTRHHLPPASADRGISISTRRLAPAKTEPVSLSSRRMSGVEEVA